MRRVREGTRLGPSSQLCERITSPVSMIRGKPPGKADRTKFPLTRFGLGSSLGRKRHGLSRNTKPQRMSAGRLAERLIPATAAASSL